MTDNDGQRDDGGSQRRKEPKDRLVLAVGAVAVLLVAGLTSALVTVAAGGAPSAGTRGDPAVCGSGAQKLTVSGSGTVTTTPNLLTLSLDVSTTGADVADALGANDAATAAVVKALTAGGVASKDVQTTDLSIQANYADTGSAVTGYSVDNTVVARIRKLSSAGTDVDAAVTAGGNATRVDSLAFSLTNPKGAEDRARTIAVHEAVGHAAAIASAASERLGEICSIKDESSTTTTPVPYYRTEHAAATGSASVPVEAGTETVTAQVSIVYAVAHRPAP